MTIPKLNPAQLVALGEARRRIDAGEPGSAQLSSLAFVAFGGEFRREPISKQSSEMGPWLPYWPDGKDCIMFPHLSTNLQDLRHQLTNMGVNWGLSSLNGVYRGWVNDGRLGCNKFYSRVTPCLALLEAALALVASKQETT